MTLPKLEYFDGTGALAASDGDGVGRTLAWDADASDEEMREIARRCNAHDALAKALREARAVLNERRSVEYTGKEYQDDEVIAACDKIDAALETEAR